MRGFCWHDWTAWSEPTNCYDIDKKAQFRKCTKCNAYESKFFKHPYNILADSIIKLLKEKE